MKTKCNKLIALLLSLTMLMGVVMSTPMTAVAAEIGQATVTLNNELKAYKSTGDEITSNSKIDPTSGSYRFYVDATDGNTVSAEVSVTVDGESYADYGDVSELFTVSVNAGTAPKVKDKIKGKSWLVRVTPTADAEALLLDYESAEITITVSQSAPPKDVTFPVANGYRITDAGGTTLSGKTVQVSDTTYTFKITVMGSNPAAFKPFVEAIGGEASVKEPTVERNTYQYELQNITENTEIIVTLETKTFTIKYTKEDETGFTTDIQNGKTVSYGSDYSFTVTPIDGYNPPTVSYTMEGQSGGTPLISGNNYTISNITGDVTITITTPSAKNRTVTFVAGPGYSFTEETGDTPINDSKEVSALSDLKFKVKVAEGYNDANMQVAVNGVVVPKDLQGTYTVPKSTENQSVTVTGVAQNQYTVTLVNGTGYTLRALSSTTVPHGGEFKFTVALDAGYQYNSGGEPTITVSPSGTATKDSISGANAYKVSSVTDNISISVTNVEVTKHTVSSDVGNQGRHATVNLNGGQASHNGNLTFSVTPDTGYKVNTVTVETDDGHALNVIKGGGNNWTVSGVTGNCTVSVTTTPVVITVTYNDNSPTGGSNTVSYTYDGSRTNLKDYLEDPTGVRYYTFGGWKSTRGGEGETDKTFTTADDTVTVYGTWSIDIESLFSVDLQPVTGQAGAPEGETTLDLIVKWNPDTGADTLTAQANTTITDAGILYSNSQFDFTSKDLADAISKLLTQSPQNGKQAITKETVGNNEHVYYYGYKNNGNFGDSRNNTKTVRFRVKDSANRYAIGWVAVNDGQKTYVILSDGVSQHVFGVQ